MTGLTDYSAQGTLNHWTGKTSLGSAPTVSIALFTAVGTDAGTGFTEVSNVGTGYARVTTAAANWNAASGSGPSTTSNSADLLFPSTTGSYGIVMAAGGYNSGTYGAGTLLWWDYLGSGLWMPFTCSLASPGVITCPAHGFSNGDQVVISAEMGGTLPTLSAGSWGGLQTVAGATTDTFNVGLNTTTTGNGWVRKVTSLAITAVGVTPRLAGGSPGALVLSMV